MKHILLIFMLICGLTTFGYAQETIHDEQAHLLPKVLHAEPLFIDLIRDLGARKGEKEWNIGAGITDRGYYDSYAFLVEYEWAVKDRWGLEIELPVTLFQKPRLHGFNGDGHSLPQKPSNRLESLKLATQYTFLVSEKHQASFAAGGITEFEFTDLRAIRPGNVFHGVLFNPFLIAAKRLGAHWHSLIYTGPRILTRFGHGKPSAGYELNTNLHYMIPGSRNFIGIEMNQRWEKGHYHPVLRPQMRLAIQENLMVGIVPGISLNRDAERFSAFLRAIYEPGHKHR